MCHCYRCKRCSVHVDGYDVDIYRSDISNEDVDLIWRGLVEEDFFDHETLLDCLAALLEVDL